MQLRSLLTLLAFANPLLADKNLRINLTPPPNAVISQVKAELERQGLIAPDELTKLDQKTWSLGGFLTVYGGFFDYSDNDGSVTFPLRHEDPKVYIAITPRITLIKLDQETISYMREGDDSSETTTIIPDDQSAKLYLCEKLQDSKKNWYWQVTEQKIPENRRLNNYTVIFLSNPRNLFIPLGQFPVSQEEQMFLPPVHVLDRRDIAKAITDNIEITRFLEPIKKKTDEAKEPHQMERNLVTNF